MAAPPLDDDDLLSEILLRLPPQPSSLPHASAVCKRWRSLASDPAFSRRFRRHHRRNPPLLGCFIRERHELRFQPTMEPPDRVPEGRFTFPIDAGDRNFRLLGCRHGFLLMLRTSQGTLELLVWDPVNGQEHPLAIPPGFDERFRINGSVLRTAHGGIQNFQVVLVRIDVEQRVMACVYSSETGVWGNLITTALPPNISNISLDVIDVIFPNKPAVLVGDSLYLLLYRNGKSNIIEFNVDRQSLTVIPLPLKLNPEYSSSYSVMRAGGGGGPTILFVSASDYIAQLWKRKTNCDGVTSWVLERTIELHNLLSLWNNSSIQIQGFAEENNVVFFWASGSIFKVQLDSLQFKEFPEIDLVYHHPFECVYAAGI